MSFKWDRTNERFVSEPRCPYPDCATSTGIGVAATTTQQVLGWCSACDRPYEAVLLEPARTAGRGGQPVPWTRRPDAVHCTYTGRALQRLSPLDWCEQGGGPQRNSCLDDDSGCVFGPPRKDTQLRLEPVWDCGSVDGSGGFDDSVSSISVVLGRVVAVTRRGRLATLELGSGKLLLERPLEWPSGFPTDLARAVIWAPAIRGTTAVITAPHEAVFRDIKPELFAVEGMLRASARIVRPTGATSVFLGPPLGIDPPVPSSSSSPSSSDRGPLFCLYEGRERGDNVDDPRLRFFAADGVEVASCAVEDIARPPVFDSASGCVVWVSTQGFVSMIRIDRLPKDLAGRVHALGGDDVITLMSDEILALRQSARPTLVLARDQSGHSELFVAVLAKNDETEIFRAALPEAPKPGDEVRWSRRSLGPRGELVGLAVGSSSSWAANAGGQLLAVATDLHVASVSKEEGSIYHAPLFGHEGASRRGSFEAPLVTSAGVISRVPGRLHLDTQGLDWSDASRSQILLEGRYDRAGGLALFGRKVFVGVGLGVRCFTITRKASA